MAEANNSMTGGGGDKLYKGVRRRKWGKYVSEVRLPNSRDRIWLGSYDSPLKAARAFDAALYCLRGCRGNFNFPDTPLNLQDHIDTHQSFTAQEIQVIAAKFANNEYADQESSQEGGGASNGESKPKSDSLTWENTTCTLMDAPSSSNCNTSTATMHECDGRVQVDHGDMMDWTFLNELGDYSSVVGSGHYGLCSDLDDKLPSDELPVYSTSIIPPPSLTFEDKIFEGDDDPFSNQPFLWNWKF